MFNVKSVLTPSEAEIRAVLESQDYIVLRKGWPDFLCVSKTNPDDVFGFEDKTAIDRYSSEQMAVMNVLGRFFPIKGRFGNRPIRTLVRPYSTGEVQRLLDDAYQTELG